MDDATREVMRAIRLELEASIGRALAAAGDREDGPQRVAMIMHVLATKLALAAGASPEQWQHDHDFVLELAQRGQDAPPEPQPHQAHWHRRRPRRG